jgi:hypothetical protein
MKRRHRRGACHGSGCSCESGSGEKARYMTQVTKCEGGAEPPFEQPGHEHGLAGVPEAIQYESHKASVVAHEARGDGAGYHPGHERRNSATT